MFSGADIQMEAKFFRFLKIVGVWYKARAEAEGRMLYLKLGYSHEVELTVPPAVRVFCFKNNVVCCTGIDKDRVHQFAAAVRSCKPPEVYKGKGIMYVDEVIKKKQGKKSKWLDISNLMLEIGNLFHLLSGCNQKILVAWDSLSNYPHLGFFVSTFAAFLILHFGCPVSPTAKPQRRWIKLHGTLNLDVSDDLFLDRTSLCFWWFIHRIMPSKSHVNVLVVTELIRNEVGEGLIVYCEKGIIVVRC